MPSPVRTVTPHPFAQGRRLRRRALKPSPHGRGIAGADLVFVMERAHRTRLQKRFRKSLKSARVVCLDIPDDYDFMQPELVALLEKKVGPFL